jgi:hypothetical protein
MSSSSVLLGATGRRRSPAAMPGHNAGRAPRNKGVGGFVCVGCCSAAEGAPTLWREEDLAMIEDLYDSA